MGRGTAFALGAAGFLLGRGTSPAGLPTPALALAVPIEPLSLVGTGKPLAISSRTTLRASALSGFFIAFLVSSESCFCFIAFSGRIAIFFPPSSLPTLVI